jgi:hypothetical protein
MIVLWKENLDFTIIYDGCQPFLGVRFEVTLEQVEEQNGILLSTETPIATEAVSLDRSKLKKYNFPQKADTDRDTDTEP